MKIFYKITTLVMILFAAVACEEGIDPIIKVDPGTDAGAPVISFKTPKDGFEIREINYYDSVECKIEVTDDIELGSVIVKLNGKEVGNYTQFLDYRRFLKTYMFDSLTIGTYVLTVEATDLQGKKTTGTLNFLKRTPYIINSTNEVAYFPFNENMLDYINLINAKVNGSNYLSTAKKQGAGSLSGAYDSYLSYPTTYIKNPKFTASFWYYPNTNPKNATIMSATPAGGSKNYGLRLYRTGSPTSQKLSLSVGTGSAEVLNALWTINPKDSTWKNITVSVSETEATVFVDGVAKTVTLSSPIDWTGCDQIAIEGGGPNYTAYSSDQSKMDELRFFNKSMTAAEVVDIMKYTGKYEGGGYTAKYDGEVMYMSFEDEMSDLVGKLPITLIGSPTFAAGKHEKGYQGVADAALEIPFESLKSDEFTAEFWYKINAVPDRSGILTVGNQSLTDWPNDVVSRSQGFRLFREKSGTGQQIKVNIGCGTGEVWNDGAVIAEAEVGTWIHVAMVVTTTTQTLYINGVPLSKNNAETGSAPLVSKIDWTGCTKVEFASGGKTFAYWEHKSDLSNYDDFRWFKRALSKDEIVQIYNDEK